MSERPRNHLARGQLWGLVASGAMFTVGLGCAPMMSHWRWIAVPALVLIAFAILAVWQAVHHFGAHYSEDESPPD